MKLRLLLVAFLATCASAFAQLPSNEVTFKAQAFLIKGQEFFATWDKADGPPIETVKDAKRGDELFLVVFFSGPTVDKDGKARVVFSLTMKKPNSVIVGPQNDIPAGAGAMTDAQRKNTFLASTRVPIRLTAADPAGKYTFEVKVKDAITPTNEVPITVTAEIK